MELVREVEETGQHLPRGLLFVRRGALVNHHALFTLGSLSGARVWTQPPVGTGPRPGRLLDEDLSTVATLQSTLLSPERGADLGTPGLSTPRVPGDSRRRSPSLPQRNWAVANMYPSLSTSKASTDSNGPRTAIYATHERQITPGTSAPEIERNAPKRVSICHSEAKQDATPPAADARPIPTTSTTEPPSSTPGLVGLPPPQAGGPQRSTKDIFPEGPIGGVIKQHR